MPSQSLTVDFPEHARVPERVLKDSLYLRYLIAGALYTNGTLNGRQARELTGDGRRVFEERMAEFGFPLMPGREQDILAELNA